MDTLLRLHNDARGRRRLVNLVRHPLLDEAAQGHAEWMASRDILNHTGNGRSRFTNRIADAGYEMRSAAENIAIGSSDSPQIFKMWMKSRGHRSNILGAYIHCGFGLAESIRGKKYWCAVFATPNIED